MEQQTGSKLGEEYVKAVYCHPAYLTYMQSTSWLNIVTCLFNFYAKYIMQNASWMKHRLESQLLGEITITSDMQMTPPLWQKVKRS